MTPTPSILASGLTVRFGPRTALDGVDLVAQPGRVTALLGPNGAGKTTFIRCCTNLVRPTAGQVLVDGYAPADRRAGVRIGLMPQGTGAWSGIRAGELVRYLARLHADPQPVPALLRLVGIQEAAHTPYRRLSGGQKQAVNLAAALVGRPSVVFLDEPTAGLDVRARRDTWDIIRRVRDAGAGVLLTTHDMREAGDLADVVHIIDRGRITASGTVAELTARSSLEDVFLAHTHEGR